jgi:hypothetical protein
MVKLQAFYTTEVSFAPDSSVIGLVGKQVPVHMREVIGGVPEVI